MKETVLQHPGANVSSDFGIFPSVPFLKVRIWGWVAETSLSGCWHSLLNPP